MARLELRKIKHVSKLELTDLPITIGRSSSNTIVLEDTHVSRKHCVIEMAGGEPRLRDLESHGGTLLNGQRISQAVIYHGDRISVGPFDLVFKEANEGEPSQRIRPAAAQAILNGTSPEALEIDLADHESEPVTASAELAPPTAGLERQQIDVDDSQEQARQSEIQRIAELQQQLETQRTELAAQIEQLRSASATRTAELERQLSDERAGYAAEIERITSLFQQSDADRSQLAAEIEQWRSANSARTTELEQQLANERLRHAAEIDRVHEARQQIDGAWSQLAADMEQMHLDDQAKMVDLRRQLDLERTQMLAEIDEKHRAGEAELVEMWQQLDARRSQCDLELQHLSELRQQLETAHSRIEELNVRNDEFERERQVTVQKVQEMDAAIVEARQHTKAIEHDLSLKAQEYEQASHLAQSLHDRLEQIEAQHRRQIDDAARTHEQLLAELERLKSHEATLQEQVTVLEASRRIVSERAELSSRSLSQLRGQVRSLDEAARKAAALQNKLSDIEQAWIRADQQIDEAQSQSPQQLEAAALARHRISTELDALSRLRDAALARLSESAQQLRALTDRQNLQITGPIARREPQPAERRWWKFRKPKLDQPQQRQAQ